MKKFLTLSVLTSALVAPMLASAADTAELKLVGKITPSACTPNFTGGATIDYGNIAASSLSSTSQTLLPEKTTKFSVVCDAPVKFGFTVTDERSATVITSLDTISGYGPEQKFGLGAADDGSNIGAYSMQISNETTDTGTTQRLLSLDSGATWAVFGGSLGTNRLIAFSDSSSSTTPGAKKSVSMDVRVVAAVDKTSNLPITDEINIDGLTTFEVKYL